MERGRTAEGLGSLMVDTTQTPGTGERAPTPASLLIPLVGSLLLTSGAVWFLCRTPSRGSVSWAGLLGAAATFLVVAAGSHTVAVALNRRVFREHVDAPWRLLLKTTWPCVMWTPLWILLLRENSDWMMLLPPVMAVSAVLLLKGWVQEGSAPAPGQVDAGAICSVFRCPRPEAYLRSMAPALLTAVLIEGAVAEMARGGRVRAGLLLGLATIYPVQRYPLRAAAVLTPGDDPRGLVRGAGVRTAAVFLLLLLALTPYLGSGGGGWARLMRVAHPPAPAVARSQQASERAGGAAYSGIVLVIPRKTRLEVRAPTPIAEARVGAVGQKPVVIPFDGMYWYFKEPDERPRQDAPVVKGDPTQRTVRSTDLRPLVMEAHQRLDDRVAMGCCAALLLVVRNADRGMGVVAVEVRVRDRTVKRDPGQSLGNQVVASSEADVRGGSAVKEETLRFAFPHTARGRWFDEITVVIRPAGARARTGAHLAVERFELVP